MTDTVSKEHRSWVMSRIRSGNTKPELVMRSLLHRAGFRYSLRRKLPGKPDIIFPKYGAVLFVNGCFWHWHRSTDCKISKVPKSNKTFWREKLKGNSDRDVRNGKLLEGLGWRVKTVWECEVLGTPAGTLHEVVKWLRQRQCHDAPFKAKHLENGVKGVLLAAETRHQYLLGLVAGKRRYHDSKNS